MLRRLVCLSGALVLALGAADTKNAKSTDAKGNETVAKPLSAKEQKKRQKQLEKELAGPYKKWLNEDVVYIITDEERQAFKRLNTDEEREQFVENFWLRRDPTPDTAENEFKEEHYRRIAYANEHYASGIPGWKADRGRIYITFGPPDEIESHPSGGTYERPPEEGGGTTSTYPFEQWRYRYLDGIGTNIILEFVDPTMTGEYRLTMDPSEKDALLYVPNAGLTLMEQMGLSSKTDRFNRTDGTHLGQAFGGEPMSMNEFERLELYAKVQKPPPVKFKDLEAAVDSHIRYNTLPFQIQTDYVKITDNTVLTAITIQVHRKDLVFKEKEGLQHAVVNVFGRITTVSRRVANVFEDVVTVDTPTELLQQAASGSSIYQKSVPLAPGLYRLSVVLKDVVGETMSTYETALRVPKFEDDKLASSSLILADVIEKVPMRSIGTGQFVVGSTKIRPRIGETFKRDEKLGIYLQAYNLGMDEATKRPKGSVEYEISHAGKSDKVFDFSEDINTIKGASAQQVTIEKLMPLASLQPGQYTLKMKITDDISKQSINPTANFTVK
ncbi:MAG TPA: GWxTD domain-containing protein [Bryobacterales bacterium]|nr:GWxTD domain-containing protein [Bryobacterales bacterium]